MLRPQPDLNRCFKDENLASWTRLDDGAVITVYFSNKSISCPHAGVCKFSGVKVKYTNNMLYKKIFSDYVYPIATISGTIIGVGIFSLPYIASKVGILVMLAYFLFLGTLVIFVHQFFGEISLRTPDFKRLPGFAKIYLGKKGEAVAYITTILGLLGALLAYLIVGGEFLEGLFSPVFGGSNFVYTLFYFAAGSALIFFGIKAVKRMEFWGVLLFSGAIAAIFIKALPVFRIENFFPPVDINYLFFPYGAVLFSLWGASLIPEVEEMLGPRKKLLKKIIPVSILIPIFVSLFFIAVILGATGERTTESALLGLKESLGGGVVSFGIVFGVLTTFTSFIALGLTLKKVFIFDLGLKNSHAFIITCFAPLILFLLGLKSFILVISFVGGVLLSIDGILILLMYQKIKGKKFVILPLLLVFIFAVVYQLVYFLM